MSPTPAKKQPAKKATPRTEAKTSAVEVSDATRVWTDRRISLVVMFLCVLLGGIAAVITISTIQSRSNGEVLDIIIDSVDPGGKRFERGQAQTATAVSSINEISVLASYCAHRNADLAAIQACVIAEYAKAHPTTTTTPQ